MEYKIQDITLDSIADAINEKTGEAAQMTPAEMVEKIASIPAGDFIPTSEKGVANGVATLGEDGKVPDGQLPAGLKGASGTLTVAGWAKQANDSFAQTVTISNLGLTSASNVIVDCALSMSDLDADVSVLEGWGNVNNAVAGTNQLTFYCYAVKPDVNIPVNVVVSG